MRLKWCAIRAVEVRPKHTLSGLKPTGAVTVSESSIALCTITLSAGTGSCTLSARRLAVGTYDVIAAYGGDKSFEPSVTGGRLTIVV